ncbi:MAG TPA: hypothetical protein VKV20_19135 [Ktedonobacteraceae bacterium]|nr:hypothetical protein [Ktedonobacteraceae bacterium]
MDDQDIQHIHETVQYTIEFFHRSTNSLALRQPGLEMRKSYATSYIQAINFFLEPVGKKLIGEVISVDGPEHLLAIKFSQRMLEEKVPDVQLVSADRDKGRALSGLHQLSTEAISHAMYYRRTFKIYDENGTSFFIIKPSERLYWTRGAALSDAEETLAELIQ